MIDIKDIDGNIILSTPINVGSKRRYTLMTEDYILLKFSLLSPISFWIGSKVDDTEIGLFEVTDTQKPKFNTRTGGYDYELRLDNHYWKWKNKIFKYSPENPGNEATWDLTATLDVHLSIFVRNLAELGYRFREQDYTFVIDSSVTSEAKLISYSNTNMLDALTKMAEAWNCEWWIEDNIIHLGRCEYGSPVALSLDTNVVDMTAEENKSTYATRIYAFGSTRNLPTNYRPLSEQAVINGIVQKRLMLPEGIPYIDSAPNMRTEEAVEQVVIFEDIYPRTDGYIASVSTYEGTVEDKDGNLTTETFYRFTDSGFIFSEEYLLPDVELRMVFQSGALNGMDFGVKFNPNAKTEKLTDGSINPAAQLFEIVVNEDYGRRLPAGSLIPAIGDKFILYGWDSTKIAELGLISKAESELKAEAEKYIEQTQIDPNTYVCKMMSDWIRDAGTTTQGKYLNPLTVGDRVTLYNNVYFKGGSRQSRIIGIEYNLDIPYDTPIYTVGETTAYSRIGELEKSIENLTVAGQTYIGTSDSSVYIIGTSDPTTPTNRNAFSALRSLREFLSKSASDRTPYALSVGQRLTAEGGIQFGRAFASGLTGFGGRIDDKGDAELDSLFLRRWLEVPELRYNRVSLGSSVVWHTPGGGIVESVQAGLTTGVVRLKLEEGELPRVAVGDICLGIFHDMVPSQNATSDTDDGKGNFQFSGFSTIYFRIDSVDGDTFSYTLRPGYTVHPQAAMHFACYGSFTDPSRRSSYYQTTSYLRFLRDVDDWEFTEQMIAMQLGDLSGLSVQGIDMQGIGLYADTLYYRQSLSRVDIKFSELRVEAVEEDGTVLNAIPTSLSPGQTLRLRYGVWFQGQVMGEGVTWSKPERSSGDDDADAAWSQAHELTVDSDGFAWLELDPSDLGDNFNTLFTQRAVFMRERNGYPVYQSLARSLVLERPEALYVDRGPWQDGERYLFEQVNADGKLEISDCWDRGQKWRNLVTHVADADNRPGFGSSCWEWIGGDPEPKAEFIEPDQLFKLTDIEIPLTLRVVWHGEDITGFIPDADVVWSRYSTDSYGNERTALDAQWNAQNANLGKAVVLTEADCQTEAGGYSLGVGKLVFSVEVTIRDPHTAEPMRVLRMTKEF